MLLLFWGGERPRDEAPRLHDAAARLQMQNAEKHLLHWRSPHAFMSNLGTSLLGDSDGHRDAASASAPSTGAGKFPLVNKVCMGVTAVM